MQPYSVCSASINKEAAELLCCLLRVCDGIIEKVQNSLDAVTTQTCSIAYEHLLSVLLPNIEQHLAMLNWKMTVTGCIVAFILYGNFM